MASVQLRKETSLENGIVFLSPKTANFQNDKQGMTENTDQISCCLITDHAPEFSEYFRYLSNPLTTLKTAEIFHWINTEFCDPKNALPNGQLTRNRRSKNSDLFLWEEDFLSITWEQFKTISTFVKNRRIGGLRKMSTICLSPPKCVLDIAFFEKQNNRR